MTPLTLDYKGSKAPGALFAILLTLGVNVALFAVLGWVNHRSDDLPSTNVNHTVHHVELQKVQPPRAIIEEPKVQQSKPTATSPRQAYKPRIQSSRPQLQRPAVTPQKISVELTLPPLELAPHITSEIPLPDADASTSVNDDVGGGGAGILDESDVDSRAKPIYSPNPHYPFSARKLGHTGTVTIRLVITKEGEGRDFEIKQSSGHSSLDRRALEAIRSWRFKPAEHDGVKVDVRGTVSINFDFTR